MLWIETVKPGDLFVHGLHKVLFIILQIKYDVHFDDVYILWLNSVCRIRVDNHQNMSHWKLIDAV